MSRPKNSFPSQRVRLDGYVRMAEEGVTENPREQKFFEWYLENVDERRAFPMAKALLVAALNGELGTPIQEAVRSAPSSTEQALQALDEAMEAWMK